MQAIDRSELLGPAPEVAAALLGQLLVRRDSDGQLSVGRLVELEAYAGQGEDPSSHGFGGPRPRCRSMFGAPGTAYVFATQGRCCCLNVSVGAAGTGSAVLLRALEPRRGVERMLARRLARLGQGPTRERLLAGRHHELARGPGLLCLAFDVDRGLDGIDLTDASGPLFLARGTRPARPVWTERIGLNPDSASCHWPWRVVDVDSRAVSGPARLHRGLNPARGPASR